MDSLDHLEFTYKPEWACQIYFLGKTKSVADYGNFLGSNQLKYYMLRLH